MCGCVMDPLLLGESGAAAISDAGDTAVPIVASPQQMLAIVPFVPRPVVVAGRRRADDDGGTPPMQSPDGEAAHREQFPPPALCDYGNPSRVCPTCMRPFLDIDDEFFFDGPSVDDELDESDAEPLTPAPMHHNFNGGVSPQECDFATQSIGQSAVGGPQHQHGNRRWRRRRGPFSSAYFRSLPPLERVDARAFLSSIGDTESTRRDAFRVVEVSHRSVSCSESVSPPPPHSATTADEEEEDASNPAPPPLDDESRLMREGYYAKHFTEVHKVGGGAVGAVYLCRHVMEGVTLGLFAVKKIPVGSDPKYLATVLHEVRVMTEIRHHPNVLEYHHSWVDYAKTADFGPIVRCLFVLMEYATEGSLDSYLAIHGHRLPDVAVWYFFLSALAGLSHLHSRRILHRDLKPQNLLITKVDGRAPRLLLADFGTAALLNEDLALERTGGTGTLEYMAPELFEQVEVDQGDDEERSAAPGGGGGVAGHFRHAASAASDIWSLGLILHYLCCGGMLPTALSDGSVALHVARDSPIPRPAEMTELMDWMLQRDPGRRPTCADILRTASVQRALRLIEGVDELSASLLGCGQFASATPSRPQSTGSGVAMDAPAVLVVRRSPRGTARSHRHANVHSQPPPLLLTCREEASDSHQQQQPTTAHRSARLPSRSAMTRVASLADSCTVPLSTANVECQTDVSSAEWAAFVLWRSAQRISGTSGTN